MIDFEKARTTMVDCQIRPSDVTNYDLIAAFLSVAREEFVPAAQRSLAYIDGDICISSSPTKRWMMDASNMSKLIQLAEIKSDNIVLDVGCGSGYSTAVLAQICTSVVALESDKDLADQASETLMRLNVDNAVVVNAPLEKGIAKEGPFDAIFFGGSIAELPEEFSQQLKVDGRLVVVEGEGNTGVAKVYVKSDSELGGRIVFNCAARPLPGFEKRNPFVF